MVAEFDGGLSAIPSLTRPRPQSSDSPAWLSDRSLTVPMRDVRESIELDRQMNGHKS